MDDRYDNRDGNTGYGATLRNEYELGDEQLAELAPQLSALLVVAGTLPVTWLLPSVVGYALAGVFVCALLAYELALDGVPERFSPVTILFGLYWLLLFPQFAITGRISFLPYILLTPLTIGALIIGAPRLVERDPQRYAATLTGIVVVLTAIGAVLLLSYHLFGTSFPYTGHGVLGWYPYRIASVFTNSNYFGFAAAIGTLSALYLALEQNRELWRRLFGVLAIATVFSNNRTALVAGLLGALILVRQSNVRITRRFSVPVVTGLVLGSTLLVTQVVQMDYFELAWMSLIGRLRAWEFVFLEATSNPVIGSGFDVEFMVHNSYLGILLHAGFVAGWIYILAIVWAIATGAIRMLSGTLWDAYVFATLVFVAVYMTMESTTIGGLSMSSLLIALYIGLAARPTGGPFDVALRDIIAAFEEGRNLIDRRLNP